MKKLYEESQAALLLLCLILSTMGVILLWPDFLLAWSVAAVCALIVYTVIRRRSRLRGDSISDVHPSTDARELGGESGHLRRDSSIGHRSEDIGPASQEQLVESWPLVWYEESGVSLSEQVRQWRAEGYIQGPAAARVLAGLQS
ncbi:hypothetical protein [Arthrobacter sp. NPDC090010]|uniref:hypothetical protein n=1 Tax=Arthrobacter sp. NPDC090010 TaxID=3363942 RepID=UPI0038070491